MEKSTTTNTMVTSATTVCEPTYFLKSVFLNGIFKGCGHFTEQEMAELKAKGYIFGN